VPRKDTPGDEVREFLRKIGSKGGKARAKKYDTKTFRKWAKESERAGLQSTEGGPMREREESKRRGVFEKIPGSGVWWIRYFDQFGKKRREKAGSKSVAIKLYGKRKQQVLEGKKLPELFRKPSINFGQLSDDALAYSKRNKRSTRRTFHAWRI